MKFRIGGVGELLRVEVTGELFELIGYALLYLELQINFVKDRINCHLPGCNYRFRSFESTQVVLIARYGLPFEIKEVNS